MDGSIFLASENLGREFDGAFLAYALFFFLFSISGEQLVCTNFTLQAWSQLHKAVIKSFKTSLEKILGYDSAK